MQWTNLDLLGEAFSASGKNLSKTTQSFKISTGVGFTVSGIFALFCGYKLLTRERSLYGDAKFASTAEIKAAGFFESKNNSLIKLDSSEDSLDELDLDLDSGSCEKRDKNSFFSNQLEKINKNKENEDETTGCSGLSGKTTGCSGSSDKITLNYNV